MKITFYFLDSDIHRCFANVQITEFWDSEINDLLLYSLVVGGFPSSWHNASSMSTIQMITSDRNCNTVAFLFAVWWRNMHQHNTMEGYNSISPCNSISEQLTKAQTERKKLQNATAGQTMTSLHSGGGGTIITGLTTHCQSLSVHCQDWLVLWMSNAQQCFSGYSFEGI